MAARFEGGVLTEEEVQREAAKMPPVLRSQFDSPHGKRELAQALLDKELLVAEARERALHRDPEVQRQVQALEERLIVQRLLELEARERGPASDGEARAWYERHKAELVRPERVRVTRMLARVARGASTADRRNAQRRAEAWRRRLARGEDAGTVGAEGDGPERVRDGDLGFVSREDLDDPGLREAAFALAAPGAVSGVIELDAGFAVLRLTERQPSRVPSFEEAKHEIQNRLQPRTQRRVFDEVVARLRETRGAQVMDEALQ